MARRTMKVGDPVVRMTVQLRDVDPPVWRRIEVPAAATLAELHTVLQAAMGWTDSHLHDFHVDGARYAVPEPDWDVGEVGDEARVHLQQFARPGTQLEYLYDFGDSWEHVLTVESVHPAEPGVPYPRCLDGARACPPEDVGGSPGYENFLEALRDPEHEEHEFYTDWGGSFDPHSFHLAATNAALARIAWKTAALHVVPDPEPAGPGLTLRCTGKLLKAIGVRPADLPELPPSPQDWYLNLVWIDGRKCLVAMHAGTLFSLFLPDVRVADLRPLGAAVVPALAAELQREDLPADTFGPLDPAAVQLATTADRSVLGSLTDLANRCDWIARNDGGLAQLDLDKLHHHFQRTPYSARGFAYPIDLVRRQLGATDVPSHQS
ncbi:plasmid pRiA4b ORF-3 family protein [Sporichthya polymorpha]|uniref:plasmid pRiA4b ORF-3 family protein n=1 Tax=Sporichthya polymorpha TaxID=35751 RepID=UPI000362617D|nr:plasmid pRiA4b ORF-3 family protein [Sporichthya polymorpha]